MKIGLLAALVAIGVVAGLSAPDVKRYMKLRNM
jgi:Flp pilus assembly pilin Flp